MAGGSWEGWGTTDEGGPESCVCPRAVLSMSGAGNTRVGCSCRSCTATRVASCRVSRRQSHLLCTRVQGLLVGQSIPSFSSPFSPEESTVQTPRVPSQASLSGTGELLRCQGSSGHPGLCDTGWILTCSQPSPRRSAAGAGRRGGPAGDADADVPNSPLRTLVKFLLIHFWQCAVIHAISISCLFLKLKETT